jgi:hypothetical protein
LEGLAMEDVGIFYGHLVDLRPFDILYRHLLYFVVIWYIFPRFGVLYHEKSGNPAILSPEEKPTEKQNSFLLQTHAEIKYGAKKLLCVRENFRLCQLFNSFAIQGDQIRRIFAHWVTTTSIKKLPK